MGYEIGQVVDAGLSRGVTGEALEKPIWHALTVQPGKEAASREMLKAQGVHAQYPTRETSHRRCGKTIVRKLPLITRVIYAQFKAAPNWDVMRSRRLITGVYCHGSRPIRIPYDVVRAVMGMPTVAEELAAARRALLSVNPGDQAEILEGPFAGLVVDVRKVEAGRVWFETLSGLRLKGEVAESAVQRAS